MSRRPGARILSIASLLARRPGSLLRGLAALCLLACGWAQAQTVQFSWAQVKLGSGLNQPAGVAVGPNGVYIADSGSGAVVLDAPWPGGFPQITALGPGTATPSAVAADVMGNLYVADATSQHLWIVFPGAAPPITVNNASGQPVAFSRISGLAVDAVGNLYVADGGAGTVYQVPTQGAGMGLPGTPGSYGAPTALASGLASLAGVVVDGSGDVYCAAASSGPSGYSVYQVAGPSVSAPTAIASAGANQPTGLALDAGGNFYVADDTGTVSKVAASGGTYSAPAAAVTGVAGLNGVAADGAGDLFLTGSGGALEILARADFGPVPVGSASPAMTLVFTFDRALSAAPTTAVLTQGQAGGDFLDAGTGTLDSNGSSQAYGAGNTASVDVTFNPARPGLRAGAVTLRDAGSGQLLATAYVEGAGAGPQVAFQPSAGTALASSGAPTAVAADGAGNVYLATAAKGSASVVRLAPGGSVSTVLANAAYDITGLAVDGAGNVYFVDQAGNAVYLIGFSSTGYAQTPVLVRGGLNHPARVAVDGAGSVYISDAANSATGGRVLKEVVAGTGYAESVVDSGLNQPTGLAVDEFSDVYVSAATSTSKVQVLLEAYAPFLGYAQTVAVVPTGLGGPGGLALGADGGLYLDDPGTSQVVKETPGASGYTQSSIAQDAVNLAQVADLAVDGSGNVYTAAPSRASEYDFADLPSLTFPDTLAGSTSAGQTLTIVNDGNAPLVFPAPASGANPVLPDGFVYDPASPLQGVTSSTGDLALVPGGSEALALDFAPAAAGAISGSLVLTDNHLNAANATQSIPLSGTGTAATVAVTVTLANLSQTYNGSPLPVTVTTSPQCAVDVTYNGRATVPTDAGTYAVQATVHDPSHPNYQGSASDNLVIQPAPATITLGDLNQTYTGQPLSALVLTNPPGLVWTTTYNKGATAPTQAGSYAVSAYIADSDYVGSATGTLVISKATATVTLGNLTQTYTGQPLAPTASTVPANLAVTFTYTSFGNGVTTGPTSTAPTQAGSYTVVATVSDPDYQGTATNNLVIVPSTLSPSSVMFTVSSGTHYAGSAVTLTATVFSSSIIQATGTVTFYNGSAILGQADLSPDIATGTLSTATFTTASLSPGNYLISAHYSGDAQDQSSESAAQSVTVQAAVTFTSPGASPTATPTLTVAQGGTATGSLTATFQNTTQGPLTASVSGTTGGYIVAVTAEPTVFNTTPEPTFPIGFQVGLGVRVIPMPDDGQLRLPGTGAGTFMMPGLLVIPLFRKRRRGMQLLAGLALLLAIGIMGCWSGSSSGGPGYTTTSYPVTISLQANGVVVGSTPFILNVQTPLP